MKTEHSRPLRFGAAVAGASEQTLLERLEASRLHVSFDPAQCDLVATAALTVETMRRLPIQISVSSADSTTARAIATAAAAVNPERGVKIGRPRACDFHVHFGFDRGGADLFARPERHGVRMSTQALEQRTNEQASGLGIMACTSAVGAELFKVLAAVLSSRGARHAELSWCPVTLGTDPLTAPVLSGMIELHLALVGLGAIGTATARILSMLPLAGDALLVDSQRFRKENVGTYSAGTAADAVAEPWKVDVVRALLRNFRSRRFPRPVEALVDAIDSGKERWPAVVLAGLDSPEARRGTQLLWPDRLIDGATGDTMCGLHDVRADVESPCLMCIFPARQTGPGAAERLAAVTGLPVELLRHGDQLLLEEHLRGLPRERRAQLEPMIGKPVCGLARAIGLSDLADDGYMPSVPFVSQQAACLVVGRMLAARLGVTRQPNFVQHDALVGPQFATLLDRRPASDCYCQERGRLISVVRQQRRSA
jgi:hypothetical protein